LFEHKGHITLDRLLRIAAALDELHSFQRLFEPPKARSLDELEARAARKTRKYGRSAKSSMRRADMNSSRRKQGSRAASKEPSRETPGAGNEKS
jgi:hypothetical protein